MCICCLDSWPITKSIIRRLVRYTAAGEAMQYLGESVKLMIEQRRKGGPEAEVSHSFGAIGGAGRYVFQVVGHIKGFSIVLE